MCIQNYLKITFKTTTTSDLTTCVAALQKKQGSKTQQQLTRLFRTSYYVAKNGISCSKYEGICELQKLNGVDMGNNYLPNVACRRFVSSISLDLKDLLRKDAENARFISVLSDGSADKGTA